MKAIAVVTQELDGTWTAECLNAPGFSSSGEERETALAALQDLMGRWLAAKCEKGQDPSEVLQQIEVFEMDIPIGGIQDEELAVADDPRIIELHEKTKPSPETWLGN